MKFSKIYIYMYQGNFNDFSHGAANKYVSTPITTALTGHGIF